MRKWKACLDQVEDSEEYFQQLCRRVGPELTAQYTLEEEQLQHERLSNVSVMDSVDVKDGAGMYLPIFNILLLTFHDINISTG